MLSNVVQQCGRGIRSKQDHCKTYILDAGVFEVTLSVTVSVKILKEGETADSAKGAVSFLVEVTQSVVFAV